MTSHIRNQIHHHASSILIRLFFPILNDVALKHVMPSLALILRSEYLKTQWQPVHVIQDP